MRTLRTDNTEPRPWTRQRLQLLAAAGLTVAVAVVAGVAILIAQSVRTDQIVGDGASPGGGFDPPSPTQLRDRVAAAPMASLDPSVATEPDPALTPAPPLHLPAAIDGRGPAGVQLYGHTTEGAVAQLAAIDVAVLEAMVLAYTGEVHTAWVMPGGPSLKDWDLAQDVAAFLRGARQGAAKDAATTVTVTPAGGLVKGTDGPDWVLACVLLDIHATIRADYRMGWGHCARMQWADNRWQIGAGTPPATAPSAWPGSKAAVAAGWLTWDSPEQEPAR
ncbi:MAG: hypothetical protein QM779_11680 [Propionicimonas sp.]|uniref:hypothetical protein n=1 Tax=Propionicimonas sp. TaxID=1955623 RepID=UPI003D0EA7F8